MPPPASVAELPEIVESSIVTTPLPEKMPPPRPSAPLAELPVMVTPFEMAIRPAGEVPGVL